jgi:glycosyltransferase involved in cell wall biosynthesis
LGGINPALVRVTGMDKPAICIDTVFNREVVEDPNRRLQAVLFEKDVDSVSEAINNFEKCQGDYEKEAVLLGRKIRETMSWEIIYQKYKTFFEECLNK